MTYLIYREELLKAIKKHTNFDNRKPEHINNEKVLHIGYGVDNNYARCMGVSIASIIQNNKEENIIFHVLASDLENENIQNLKRLAEKFFLCINVYDIDKNAFNLLPTHTHLPVSTYYRFILPLVLQVPRVLYIDADIICMGSIKSLFVNDKKNSIISAVPDVESLAYKRNIALDLKDHIYFNAGVLLIDIEKWNEYDVVGRVMETLASDPEKFRYLDQDALNLILTGKIHYLDKKYNCINTPDMMCKDIVFLHFAAHPKPWNIAWPISKVCNEFTQDIYARYEQLTPWQDCALLLPKNYKEMKHYANALFNQGNYLQGLKWYIYYLKTKLRSKA
ncbi:glycosyltransferase family 8 protein [Anaerosinus massiliensis]